MDENASEATSCVTLAPRAIRLQVPRTSIGYAIYLIQVQNMHGDTPQEGGVHRHAFVVRLYERC